MPEHPATPTVSLRRSLVVPVPKSCACRLANSGTGSSSSGVQIRTSSPITAIFGIVWKAPSGNTARAIIDPSGNMMALA